MDEIHTLKGLASDYAVAKLLRVGPTTISNYRRNRSQMSDEMALRIAAFLDRPPAPILAGLAAERAKDAEVAKGWREAAQILASSKVRRK